MKSWNNQNLLFNLPTPSAPKMTILGLGKDLIKTSESIEFKDFA